MTKNVFDVTLLTFFSKLEPFATDTYYALCDQMEPEEKAATQRAMGMKMEQLKAELKMLDHAHDDD